MKISGRMRWWVTNLWKTLDRWWLIILVLTAVAGTVVVVVCYWDVVLAWFQYPGYEDKLKVQSETRSEMLRNMALVLGVAATTCFGLPLAVWRSMITDRQARTAEHSMLNSRFQTSAKMLNSKRMAARISGISVLEALAREHSKEHYVHVMNLICHFVRQPEWGGVQRINPKTHIILIGRSDIDRIHCMSDVEFAVQAISRCKSRQFDVGRANEKIVTLRDAYLVGAYLYRANLSNSDLYRANFSNSDLTEANLSNSDLTEANLSNSRLTKADFRNAVLDAADFSKATLIETVLSGASLFQTNLSNSTLDGADLSNSTLDDADLSNSVLSEANMSNATLRRANLSGADLSDVKGLRQSELDMGYKIRWANRPKLDGAIDPDTKKKLVWND